MAWYEVEKDSENVFSKLQLIIHKKYGWIVRFDDDSAGFHQKVVSAIVESFVKNDSDSYYKKKDALIKRPSFLLFRKSEWCNGVLNP